jgi:hypothetical protein
LVRADVARSAWSLLEIAPAAASNCSISPASFSEERSYWARQSTDGCTFKWPINDRRDGQCRLTLSDDSVALGQQSAQGCDLVGHNLRTDPRDQNS